MSEVSGYCKFIGFKMKSSGASFGLGLLAICCSPGFGPCGPTDIFGAFALLACVLGIAGWLVFLVTFLFATD